MQAMEIMVFNDCYLLFELGYYAKIHEMCAIAFEIFVSQCEINWEINGYNGYGGGAEDVRLGVGEGCFTYYNPRNGIALPVNFRFNPGQDPYKVINNLVRSLNWQCADEQTSRELAKFGNSGNSINVDVTMSGGKLASLLKEHCGYDKDYANGISSNDWKDFKNIVDGVVVPDCYVPEFVEGWIHIASEFLNDGPNKPAGVINLNSFNILGWEFGSYSEPCTFNIPFSHEVGHTLDSFFSPGNIDREESAHKRTKRQWDENESGYYSIPKP